MTSRAVPYCQGCAHYWGLDDGDDVIPVPERCAAYKDGIPRAIITNAADHRDPLDGDQGITYEPLTERDAEYAAILFSRQEEIR